MAMKITGDGRVISVPGLKSYIGKDVDPSIEQITKDWSFKKVCDCIGLSGYRNITMMKMERQIPEAMFWQITGTTTATSTRPNI